MLKKILFITLSLLFFLIPPSGYCAEKSAGQIGLIKDSPIQTFINGQAIQSWVIEDTVYVNIKTLEKYGYDVIWAPDTNTYNIRFDNHIEKEKILRDYKSQIISSNGISDMWYGDWIESISPQTEYFYYMHGAYVYSYNSTEHTASINFSRDIPIREINRHHFHIYNAQGVDLTSYFSLDFLEQTNTLIIEPIDDEVFDYIHHDKPLLTIEISADLKDSHGELLMTPLLHNFYINHRPKNLNSKNEDTQAYLANNQYDYIMGDKILRNIDSLGNVLWHQETHHLEITGQEGEDPSSFFKETTRSAYPHIISSVSVPDKSHFKENGYGLVRISSRSDLGLLDAPLAKGIHLDQFIQLRTSYHDPSYSNKKHTLGLDGQHLLAPEMLPNGYYNLILLEGLTLENGAVLEESIYFRLYIGEHITDK